MRLKFLFFPISLAISIFIFIGYVWPEIINVKSINQDYLNSQRDLKVAQEKQSMIQELAAKLDADTEGQAAVLNYLPTAKAEERILNEINYIATDAGVLLENVSVVDVLNVPNEGSAAEPGILTETLDAITGLPTQNQDEVVKLANTEASVKISGSYEKVRIFLENLQKISMLHSLKTLTITKGTTDQSNLSAEVVVDFGYLPPVKSSNQKVSRLQGNLDFSGVTAIKEQTTKKNSEINIGQTGKTNPFLP